jgi:hypothetical protein
MEFHLELEPEPLRRKIGMQDKILLSGSCFTEHIADRLRRYKFSVWENPNGILFNPVSIAEAIQTYIKAKEYRQEDLTADQGLWFSWDHHTCFSDPDRNKVLSQVNQSVQNSHDFLKQANWLILTLGSAFVYQLADGRVVANCHKAPASLFRKKLLSQEEVLAVLDNLVHRLMQFNSQLNILFTISPVRHLRDGFIENNRSKAVLIGAVHHLVDKFERLHYFPAYELVVDDLRDYRFYAEDMVHPNYQATGYVWDKFKAACINPETLEIMKEINRLAAARNHIPMHPTSSAHRAFLEKHAVLARELAARFPYLDFTAELDYFSPVYEK